MQTYEGVQPYQLGSKQKISLSRDDFTVRSDTQTLKFECNCQISTALKLKVINVNSENQLLKKKLRETESALQRAKKFEDAFNQSIKAGRIQTLNQKQTNIRNHESHKVQNVTPGKLSQTTNLQSCITNCQENSIFSQTNRMLGNYQTNCEGIQNKSLGESWRLKEYQFLKKLSSAQEKQTVKSLQFSIDSRQSLHQELRSNDKKHFDHEDLYSLREEYQESRLYLQKMYQNKIVSLEQKLQQLRLQNEEMEVKLKTSVQHISSKQHYQNRQTAYFPSICEEDQEQSRSDCQQSFDAVTVLNNFQSKSISSQHWGEVSQQLKSVKNTLQKVYSVIRATSISLKEIIGALSFLKAYSSKMKCIPIHQYLKLLQSKRQYSIQEKKAKMLEEQNTKLKQMLIG